MPAAIVAAMVDTDRVIRVEAAVEATAVESRRSAVDVKRATEVWSAHRTGRSEVRAGKGSVAEMRRGGVSAERARM